MCHHNGQKLGFLKAVCKCVHTWREKNERKKALVTITEASIKLKGWDIFHRYETKKTCLEGFLSIFSYLGSKRKEKSLGFLQAPDPSSPYVLSATCVSSANVNITPHAAAQLGKTSLRGDHQLFELMLH